MKSMYNYLARVYRFMVDVDIRHGAAFHWVPFFLGSVLLPFNLVLMAVLEMDDFLPVMLGEEMLAVLAGFTVSFIPGFGKWLNRQFYTYTYSRKKRGFLAQVKGYALLLSMELSPVILVLIRLVWSSVS